MSSVVRFKRSTGRVLDPRAYNAVNLKGSTTNSDRFEALDWTQSSVGNSPFICQGTGTQLFHSKLDTGHWVIDWEMGMQVIASPSRCSEMRNTLSKVTYVTCCVFADLLCRWPHCLPCFCRCESLLHRHFCCANLTVCYSWYFAGVNFGSSCWACYADLCPPWFCRCESPLHHHFCYANLAVCYSWHWQVQTLVQAAAMLTPLFANVFAGELPLVHHCHPASRFHRCEFWFKLLLQ